MTYFFNSNICTEVRHIENEIKMEYPGATFIELEPDSKDSNRFAIDDGTEAALKRIEIESLNRMLKILFIEPKDKTEKRTEGKNNKGGENNDNVKE